MDMIQVGYSDDTAMIQDKPILNCNNMQFQTQI